MKWLAPQRFDSIRSAVYPTFLAWCLGLLLLPVMAQESSVVALPDQTLEAGGQAVIFLTDFPEMDWRARIHTPVGGFDIVLRNDVAPLTVRNFLAYVSAGEYDGSFIHRSVPDFVIQGGGYSLSGQGDEYEVSQIPSRGTISSEFALSNVRGTMAMALVGGDPDSGTSQWFVNVVNNTSLDDPANGPFTVFGEINEDGMAVVDAINGLVRVNFGSPFQEVPLLQFDQNTPVVFDDFVRIPTVHVLDPPQVLNVSRPDLMEVSLTGDRLQISALGGQVGEGEVTLGFYADGIRREERFTVTVGFAALTRGNFGLLQSVGPNGYFSESYGLLAFADGGSDHTQAFSHSLQADLQDQNGSIQSPLYGRLSPNPWGMAQWVVSDFFGLVHFGADGDQYAGWVSSERFGWMRFVQAEDGTPYLWVNQLQTWFSVNADGSLTSFDFGWMIPESGSLTRYNSRIGMLTVDLSDPQGWLRSDRFGYVWFARDGTGVWFWSDLRKEWIGITPGGGFWSTKESRFLL